MEVSSQNSRAVSQCCKFEGSGSPYHAREMGFWRRPRTMLGLSCGSYPHSWNRLAKRAESRDGTRTSVAPTESPLTAVVDARRKKGWRQRQPYGSIFNQGR